MISFFNVKKESADIDNVFSSNNKKINYEIKFNTCI